MTVLTRPLPLSASEDADIQRELADWKSIVAPYQKPDRRRALWQVANTFVPFIAIWVAMYFAYDYSLGLTLALGVLNGFFLTRLFIIQHDCGHNSFLADRKQNEFLGWVCSLFTTVPFTYWSRVHAYHHGHTGQLEHRGIGDVNFLTVEEYRRRGAWGRLRYRIFRSPFVLVLVAPVLYMLVMVRIPHNDFEGWGKVYRRLYLNNTAIVAVYALLGYTLGWAAFAVIQGTTVLSFSIIAFWFFYVQHSHEEAYARWEGSWDFLLAAIRGATYYDLPRAFHWLTGSIGYHHIHHLSSRIPNYNLARCAQHNPVLQKFVTRITFTESLPMLSNKLWDERRRRMISFPEFARTEAERTEIEEPVAKRRGRSPGSVRIFNSRA